MHIDQVKQEITEIVLATIPEAYLSFSTSNLCPKRSLCIHFATSKVWANNIIHNDFGHTNIWLHDCFDKNTNEGEQFKLDSSLFGYHNYYTRYENKCKFRRINKAAPWDTVKKALTVYFTEMAKAVKEGK